jgi:hypothetical protein
MLFHWIIHNQIKKGNLKHICSFVKISICMYFHRHLYVDDRSLAQSFMTYVSMKDANQRLLYALLINGNHMIEGHSAPSLPYCNRFWFDIHVYYLLIRTNLVHEQRIYWGETYLLDIMIDLYAYATLIKSIVDYQMGIQKMLVYQTIKSSSDK